MNYGEVWDALVAAIREETSNPTAAVEPSMSADNILGWDSLAHVRIVMNAEDRTGAVIDMSDTYKAATVGALCDIIIKNIPK